MRVSVDSNDPSLYDVHVIECSKDLAKTITDCASEYMFTSNSTNPVVNEPKAEFDQYGSNRVKALISLAKAHMEVRKNKISTIRDIRTVSGFGLLEAKQLVDYATGSPVVIPEWLKDAMGE